MNKELHDKAWNLLEEKGLTLGEKIMIRSHFSSAYKEEYPFISIKYEKGNIKYYFSTIEEISNLAFETEKEVILANAIYENMKEDFNNNDFVQTIKYVFRLINIKSKWV